MSEEICEPHSDQCLRGFQRNASDRNEASRHDLPLFRIPDSRFWDSEFRIPYGIWEIWNTAP